MLLSLLLPMTPAPAIGLPRPRRLPPFVGPHDPPHHQGDDAQAHQVEENVSPPVPVSSGPAMSNAKATAIDARLCRLMKPTTATATALIWVNRSLMRIRTSLVL